MKLRTRKRYRPLKARKPIPLSRLFARPVDLRRLNPRSPARNGARPDIEP